MARAMFAASKLIKAPRYKPHNSPIVLYIMGNPTKLEDSTSSDIRGNSAIKTECTDDYKPPSQPTPYEALILVARMELEKLPREIVKKEEETPETLPAPDMDTHLEATSAGGHHQGLNPLRPRFESVMYYDAKYSIWCRGEIADLQDYSPYAIMTPEGGVIEYYPVLSVVRRWEISFFPIHRILAL
ncbi:hypothetical protein ACG7TL_001058 [Trametes sanguinea]